MKKKKNFAPILVLIALFFSAHSDACTNLIVGKNASVDGSVLVSYSSDDYGMFGSLWHFAAGTHAKGTKRAIYEWETNKYLGEIDEAEVTYSVIGNINEFQVTIAETTFGGRLELVDSTGVIDYGSLIYIALQRSRTAREAITVMTDLVKQYGYCSEGESFTVADKKEAWILELIGKGVGNRGAVWVAQRVPDDCISAHANQSRIHKFPLKDKQNCIYSPDVISFARRKGWFTGKNSDFDFANAYCPAGFGELRYCEARVWSFFNKWGDGMDAYLDYVKGEKTGLNPMPLFLKPNRKLRVQDVENAMRDHYEGTPFDITNEVGAGPYNAPYRPTPLSWEYDGKMYFNERPISTQQAAFVFVSQMRSSLPDAIGGILWFGNDDANMIAFTPVYCCATTVPECYSQKTADGVSFSFKSAFWVCNWVSNMVYPRYSMLFEAVKDAREELEENYFAQQPRIEAHALALLKQKPEQARDYLNQYTTTKAQEMLHRWQKLGEYIIVKYNDQAIKPDTKGCFSRTTEGLGAPVKRVGFPDAYRKIIVEKTGTRYLLPVLQK
ncbi:MAG: C69 family dipeptidase [Bacteroidaceae bacterium]